MTAISNRVSLAVPYMVIYRETRILQILNEDLKCSELCVALCVKYTLQKKSSCLQPGHIRVKSAVSLFNRVICGSNPGLTRITKGTKACF